MLLDVVVCCDVVLVADSCNYVLACVRYVLLCAGMWYCVLLCVVVCC